MILFIEFLLLRVAWRKLAVMAAAGKIRPVLSFNKVHAAMTGRVAADDDVRPRRYAAGSPKRKPAP
jgi:hypothetical protein